MPSTFANTQRRRPQQARAAARRASFLEVAARLIAETGFDAVTMTAVAEQADASIGTLYDYFPDKQSLASALMAQYLEEADAHWKRVLEDPQLLKKKALADLFVEEALAFARSRPAYLQLFGTSFVHVRSAAARQSLRKAFADALCRLNPKLTASDAFMSAQIIVELLKGLFAVSKQVERKDLDRVTLEFKKLMRFYVHKVLGAGKI